jgi:voltage-dependent calcium channel
VSGKVSFLYYSVSTAAFTKTFSSDPEGIQPDFKHEFQFCGGYLDNVTFQALPWIYPDGRQGAKSPKGYLCPAQSKCILDDNPYNGTVSFDNIFQSLELVFVIMSSNTFSDLIYYTADSDYLIASMCKLLIVIVIVYSNRNTVFIVGVVILAFWLVNLLVAVITTSFQIIREESKKRSAFTENEQ